MICNVRSGRAIKHVKESIFTDEAGARRGIPKVLTVLTDGRSQDDVNKISKDLQMEGEGRSSAHIHHQHREFIVSHSAMGLV